MNKDATKHWYVLYTRSQQEKRIAAEIGKTVVHECYLPVKRVLKQWSDRVKRVEVPLFANYVFVKTYNTHRSELFDIPGIVRFVSIRGQPVTMPETEIQKLRVLEQAVDIRNEKYLTTGSEVTIRSGIFAGLTGILIKRLKKNNRLLIRIPLLRQAVSVQVTEELLLN